MNEVRVNPEERARAKRIAAFLLDFTEVVKRHNLSNRELLIALTQFQLNVLYHDAKDEA